MKALCLWQPWASLIPLGFKLIETRSWQTKHRGDLLICSALKHSKEQEDWFYANIHPLTKNLHYKELPFGAAVAIVDLFDCVCMDQEMITRQRPLEKLVGNWQVGRYAWHLRNIRPITPFRVTGKQSLFEVDVNLQRSYRQHGG